MGTFPYCSNLEVCSKILECSLRIDLTDEDTGRDLYDLNLTVVTICFSIFRLCYHTVDMERPRANSWLTEKQVEGKTNMKEPVIDIQVLM